MAHGVQKLVGLPPGGELIVAFSLPWFAGVTDLTCGALLVIGLLTRVAAFLASGKTVLAYWIAHAPQSVYAVNNRGDAAILFCFVILYFVFSGGGPLSVDALLRSSRETHLP